MLRKSLLGVLLAFSVTGCISPSNPIPQASTPNGTGHRQVLADTDAQAMDQDEKQKVDEMTKNPVDPEELKQNIPQKISAEDADKMLVKLDSDKIAETTDQDSDSAYNTQQRRGWGVRHHRFSRLGRNFFYPNYAYSYYSPYYSPYYYRPLYYYPYNNYYIPYYFYDNAYYPYYYSYNNSYVYPYFYNTGRYYRPFYYYGNNFWWRHRNMGGTYWSRWGSTGWHRGRGRR